MNKHHPKNNIKIKIKKEAKYAKLASKRKQNANHTHAQGYKKKSEKLGEIETEGFFFFLVL